MSKRLHVHALPLLLFSVAVVVISAVGVSSQRIATFISALVTPAISIERTGGWAKVELNDVAKPEPVDVANDLPVRGDGLLQASRAGRSVVLLVAVDEARASLANQQFQDKRL